MTPPVRNEARIRLVKPEPRFTFIFDRSNRTAATALVTSLEGMPTSRPSIRIARGRQALDLDFSGEGGPPEFVCMSAMTENFAGAVELLRQMRARFGDHFISVCGGPHATGDPESVLSAGFDVCAIGEGETVLRRLASGPVQRGTKIAGEPVHLNDFAALPRETYFPGCIEIARGCRWGCAYCQTPRIFGHDERFRSVDLVSETVARYAPSGMMDIRLLLPNALGYESQSPGVPNCGAIEKLLAAMRQAGGSCRIFLGSFPSEVRPDYVTPEAIAVLKKYVANMRIVIGAQSGSQRVLDAIGRGHSTSAIMEACDVVRSGGFVPAADIVIGFPMEGEEDRKATFDLVERLGAAGATVNMHFFMPLTGTPLADTSPRFLADEERKYLDGLAAKGVVRGSWRRQEQIARKTQAH